jgi:hypothetical protein
MRKIVADILITNWNTTCAGIAVLALTISFLTGHLEPHAYLALVGTCAGGGLLLSKDGNK